MSRIPVWLFLGVALLFSCAGGNADNGDQPSTNTPGAEGNPCFPNGTCMSGLTCLSKMCVNTGAGGSGSVCVFDNSSSKFDDTCVFGN